MEECRFCDAKESTKVCKNCLGKMVYKTNVLKRYKLTSEQLSNIFCVTTANPKRNNSTCTKYHIDDIINLQKQLIKTSDNKQIKIDHIHKSLSDSNESNKLDRRKKQIRKNVEIGMTKINKNLIQCFKTQIDSYVDQYVHNNIPMMNIVTFICVQLEPQFKKMMSQNERKKALTQMIDDNIPESVHNKYAKELFMFGTFVTGGNINKLKDIFEDIQIETTKKMKMMERETAINNMIDSNIKYISHIKIAKQSSLYIEFIHFMDIENLDSVFEDIKIEIHNTLKSDTEIQNMIKYKNTVQERQNAIYKLIDDNISEKYRKNAKSWNKCTNFIHSGKISNIRWMFYKLKKYVHDVRIYDIRSNIINERRQSIYKLLETDFKDQNYLFFAKNHSICSQFIANGNIIKINNIFNTLKTLVQQKINSDIMSTKYATNRKNFNALLTEKNIMTFNNSHIFVNTETYKKCIYEKETSDISLKKMEIIKKLYDILIKSQCGAIYYPPPPYNVNYDAYANYYVNIPVSELELKQIIEFDKLHDSMKSTDISVEFKIKNNDRLLMLTTNPEIKYVELYDITDYNICFMQRICENLDIACKKIDDNVYIAYNSLYTE